MLFLEGKRKTVDLIRIIFSFNSKIHGLMIRKKRNAVLKVIIKMNKENNPRNLISLVFVGKT